MGTRNGQYDENGKFTLKNIKSWLKKKKNILYLLMPYYSLLIFGNTANVACKG